jgi:hypothetical protein
LLKRGRSSTRGTYAIFVSSTGRMVKKLSDSLASSSSFSRAMFLRLSHHAAGYLTPNKAPGRESQFARLLLGEDPGSAA